MHDIHNFCAKANSRQHGLELTTPNDFNKGRYDVSASGLFKVISVGEPPAITGR